MSEDSYSVFRYNNKRNLKKKWLILPGLVEAGVAVAYNHQIILSLEDFTITDRRYIGHEDDTGFHHYAIDVAKLYGLEE